MTTVTLESAVRNFAAQLASGEFERIIRECHASRLAAAELRQATQDFGITLVKPPADA